MAASTLLDVITGALGALNEVGFGQSVSAEDGALGLRLANLLLQKLSVQRLYLPYVAIRTYVLAPSTASYSVGPTAPAPFTSTRPTFIESAQINVLGTNVWLPLNIIDKGQWDAIRNKGALADIPEDVYPEYSFPSISLYFNPAPIGSPSVRLGVWEPLSQFLAITDILALPVGYEEYLEAMLAAMLAPYYNKPVSKELADRVTDASMALMKINAQGMGGALGDSAKLQSPNVGAPMPGGGA